MNTTIEKYVDQILDRFGHEGDKVFYELFINNNLAKFSKLSVVDFEDIYYSLFDDELGNFLNIKEKLREEFDIEEYDEYVDIILKEITLSAMKEFSYVRFLAGIPKEQWNGIIEENLNCYQKKTKSQRIYDFYKDKIKQECRIK